jgi:hypothetical protein
VPDWDPEIEVDENLARALIADQFPSLDVTSLRRIGEGWDNTVWATVEDIAFRHLPDAAKPRATRRARRRSREVLALFFDATIAAYAHDKGIDSLEQEALEGLGRTVDD